MELRQPIIAHLSAQQGPADTLAIAKAILGSKATCAMVNPILYRMQIDGLISKLPTKKPHWQLITNHQPNNVSSTKSIDDTLTNGVNDKLMSDKSVSNKLTNGVNDKSVNDKSVNDKSANNKLTATSSIDDILVKPVSDVSIDHTPKLPTIAPKFIPTNDLEVQITTYLTNQTEPISAKTISKAILPGIGTRSMVNPTLYRMKRDGKLIQHSSADGKVTWKLNLPIK